MASRSRSIPLIVALPLFLQNVDIGGISVALPAVAASLHVETLALNLAVTAYLVSLAIFLPASGWLAERFGAKQVFCWAIGLFTVGSALCGLSQSVPQLVACRVLQGAGGALMLPVGRLLLLRSTPAGGMVDAMIWFTVPPAIGRMLGPLAGGVVLSLASWRYVFLVNVAVGIAAIVLAARLVEADEPPGAPVPFDGAGFVLLGGGLAALLAGLQTAAHSAELAVWSLASVGAGAVLLLAYWRRSRRSAAPLVQLSLVRYRSFFASVVAGLPIRLAVGAAPFVLPLAFQLGFGLSALETGALMTAPALASLAARGLTRKMISRFGFHSLLFGAAFVSGLCYAAYPLFHGGTPRAALLSVLLLGGLANSLVLVTLQALAFSEIPKPFQGHATALSTMAQQVSSSLGLLLCVELIRLWMALRSGAAGQPVLGDFTSTIALLGVASLATAAMFSRLPKDIGADLR